MTFRDRRQAGQLLATKLERYRGDRPVVLGLTRGGVPVAAEVASFLRTPLEPMVVRKLGAPDFPEYAVGAIAEGGAVFIDPEAIASVGLTEDDVAAIAEREAVELARRVRVYRGGRTHTALEGRTTILVDDGVATGATARAAARSARQRGAARVILAAPVIAAASVPALRGDFDAIVAVETPEPFYAVGAWYERFGEVTDADVLSELDRAAQAKPAEERAADLWDGEWIETDGAD